MDLLAIPNDMRTEIFSYLHSHELWLLSLTCKYLKNKIRHLVTPESIETSLVKFGVLSIIDYMVNVCKYRPHKCLNRFMSLSIEGDNAEALEAIYNGRWNKCYMSPGDILLNWNRSIVSGAVRCSKYIYAIIPCKPSLCSAIESGIHVDCFKWLVNQPCCGDNYIVKITKNCRYDILSYICENKLVPCSSLITSFMLGNDICKGIMNKYYSELSNIKTQAVINAFTATRTDIEEMLAIIETNFN